MAAANGLEGVVAPVLTPFDGNGAPDAERFLAHARWLLAEGCTGLAPFGTTSEAASLGLEERARLLDALIDGGIPSAQLMPGTGLTSVPDSVKLASQAAAHNVAGVLMLPPFYFKGVSDDGIFAHIAEVIEQVGNANLRVYLYHIPPVAQVGFSLQLIERLRKAYPSAIVGLKDSSGEWANTAAVIEKNPGFDVFAGSEVFLLQTLRAGGVGCITASANVNPSGIRRVFDNWETDDADAFQKDITETRNTVQAYPMIPALKAIKAAMLNDSAWSAPRPPLEPLDAADAAALVNALEQKHGFAIRTRTAA
ncbi:MAG: dihydrodipicolinate synthase family protein [Hyphomicrobiaceae bacterium]